MFASELIASVQALMNQYGDLRVLNADDGSVVDTTTVEVLTNRDVESVILISGRPGGTTALN